MDIQIGTSYMVTFENGTQISGELDSVKYIGNQIYSLWIDIGGQPVYILLSDVKKRRLSYIIFAKKERRFCEHP